MSWDEFDPSDGVLGATNYKDMHVIVLPAANCRRGISLPNE